jgi:amino-acid N-acetyltransferase
MIRIESAQPQDVDEVKEILTACGLPLEGVIDRGDTRDASDTIATRGPLDRFVVALADAGDRRALIGCAGLEVHGTACILRSLAVRPEMRGRGVARLLIEEILRRARDAGCSQAFLLTTSIEAMAARHGFTRIDRAEVPAELLATSEFALNACSTATVMQRVLRSHP